jgi:hypothetical protein
MSDFYKEAYSDSDRARARLAFQVGYLMQSLRLILGAEQAIKTIRESEEQSNHFVKEMEKANHDRSLR